MPLTAAQQDYIEIIFHLENDSSDKKIRIKDIADRLGTKLPTVTRTVKRLTELGYLSHKSHGGVRLTTRGKLVAGELAHLHKDLIIFFTEILGLPKKQAKLDACQTEHAVSSVTAQRLHEFLIYYRELDEKDKKIFEQFTKKRKKPAVFKNLPDKKIPGWRS